MRFLYGESRRGTAALNRGPRISPAVVEMPLSADFHGVIDVFADVIDVFADVINEITIGIEVAGRVGSALFTRLQTPSPSLSLTNLKS